MYKSCPDKNNDRFNWPLSTKAIAWAAPWFDISYKKCFYVCAHTAKVPLVSLTIPSDCFPASPRSASIMNGIRPLFLCMPLERLFITKYGVSSHSLIQAVD